jgi:hypothetical protein
MRVAILPRPQYIFMVRYLSKRNVFVAWYLIKHRKNFTFTWAATLEELPLSSAACLNVTLEGWECEVQTCMERRRRMAVRGCIQKFPDWQSGSRTANDTTLCTRCSCIAILWVSLVSFAATALCVASQRVFIVVYFIIDSVRKLLDTPSNKRTNELLHTITLKPSPLCEIWGFHGGDDSSRGLLGYDALKMEAARSSETLVP